MDEPAEGNNYSALQHKRNAAITLSIDQHKTER
jgi:hypothetical protein